MIKRRMHVLIKGAVQGVYFRYNTLKKAGEYHLTGWVRNKADGNVEMVCEGMEDDIDKMVRWCNQGPERAYVREVETEWKEYTGEFNVFEIR
jgi:acylphosphatase